MPLDALREKIRKGEAVSLPIAMLLQAATPAQRLGMWWRMRQPRVRVDARVISFGNITAGGTGKTPAVIERAEQEIAAGHRVAVVTRGYGSAHVDEPFGVAPDDAAENLVCDIGDESALIRRRVPEVYLVKSADRVAGARHAIAEYGCDTLILDDGFQSVTLARDEDIVVIDATNPFGNGHLIPRGILREPLSALERATAFLLTRCDQATDTVGLVNTLAPYPGGKNIRRTRHAPSALWRPSDGKELPLDTLNGASVTAVCGIGNPDAFFHTLESLGATITERHAYRDHATIPFEVFAAREFVVTTEKDAVRTKALPENVCALGIRLEDID